MSKAPAFLREPDTVTEPVTPSVRPHTPAPAWPSMDAIAPSKHSLSGSFQFAWEGFCYVARTQRSFRLQLASAAAAIVAGGILKISTGEWCSVLIVSAMVLALEMINTALEASIDMVTLDYHPLAKSAKDIAAGAVLLASGCAVAVGAVVFWPHLIALW